MADLSRRILIIDPDETFSERITALLSAGDIFTEWCGGITSAVAIMRDAFFKCVIMDVELPEMKGYEAVKIIKSLSPATSVIITAEKNSRDQESLVRAEDIVYYHLKSFDPQELRTVVKELFQKPDLKSSYRHGK